jgi:hypothetical protein
MASFDSVAEYEPLLPGAELHRDAGIEYGRSSLDTYGSTTTKSTPTPGIFQASSATYQASSMDNPRIDKQAGLSEEWKEVFSWKKHGSLYGEAAISSRLYLVLMIVIFAVAIIVGVVKAEQVSGVTQAERTGVFFRWFAVIYLPAAAIMGGLANMIPHVREGVARSMGWRAGPYQLEKGFVMAAFAIMAIVSFTSLPYQALYAVSVVWSIWQILVGSNHIYEFFFGQPTPYSISEVWWGLVPSIIMITTGTIAL